MHPSLPPGPGGGPLISAGWIFRPRHCHRRPRRVRRACAGILASAAWWAVTSPAAACSTRASVDTSVPSFEQAIGFRLGSREATAAQIDRYMRVLDRASPRVRTVLAGRSTDGRPMRLAIVSERRRMRPGRLGALAARVRAARAGALPAGKLPAFDRATPVFAWIGGTVHGNEPSGGDADMRLIHDLAAGRDCATLRTLHRVVTLVLPVQNPDGRAAGTHVAATRFDLNRDWFARTQPETRAKLSVLARYPPMVFADQHEEQGTGFFFPPNADPIHHEISPPALHAIDNVIAPGLRRAFRANRRTFTSSRTYDLFYMGYGDTAPTTLFGAAGMTFEKGIEASYPAKLGDHLLAARATIRVAAAHRRELVAGWSRQWPQAIGQGAMGTLQPNRVLQPGNRVSFPVPDRRVYGYAIRADTHAADAEALARRLVSAGVHVERLTAPVDVAALRAYGAVGSAPATLPAGTFVVSMSQAAKHWVEALLAEDPYVPFPYFYDVCSWSNPLLMGLDGGSIEAPLTIPDRAAAGVAPGDQPVQPAPGAAGYAFASGSERAAELAFGLLARGAAVSRLPDGTFTTSEAGEAAKRAASAAGVSLRPLASAAGGRGLRRPRVAVFGQTGADDGPGDLSAGWARWLLDTRFGLRSDPLSAARIATGGLGGYDALVVPDGDGANLTPAGLAALQAWVRGGGILIGWRGRGLAIARAAGLTAVRSVAPPAGLVVPGAALRITLDPTDPVAVGETSLGWAFNRQDEILESHGARVVAAYPADAGFSVSGYTTGTDALRGTPAATDEVVGGGRVVLFAFEPVFRGYTEGTERLVANALLAPAPGPATRSARRAAQPIDPAALHTLPTRSRDTIIEVAAEDERALLRAARAAGLPRSHSLQRDLSTVTLHVANPRGLDAEQRPWTRRLPSALAAAGVRPLLVVF